MSTYLVAFVVCDYAFVTKKTSNEVPVTVYAPRNLLNETNFAMDVAIRTIDFFEEFLMVPYPLPKQDLVAITDFESSSMENWGLITYRGNGILYESHESTTSEHQNIAISVTHELAHQWFGNLVSIRWWSDLWIHEGLNRYLEFVAIDNIFPEWNILEQFILDKTQMALQLDSLANSRAVAPTQLQAHLITNPVVDIPNMFDEVVYNKVAAIFYMMDQFLTRDVFRSGLRDFLNTYRYGSAESKELWNVLTQNTNYTMEVKTIMETWTHKMGYPLIRLTRMVQSQTTQPIYSSTSPSPINTTSLPMIETHMIVATQSQFLLSNEWNAHNKVEYSNETANQSKPQTEPYKWFVPLSYYTNLDAKENLVWLNATAESVSFEIAPEVKWIKLNIRQTGYYRTMYDEAMWEEIIKTLHANHTAFSTADRANLVDDVFSLSR